jgi:hypothetical protein
MVNLFRNHTYVRLDLYRATNCCSIKLAFYGNYGSKHTVGPVKSRQRRYCQFGPFILRDHPSYQVLILRTNFERREKVGGRKRNAEIAKFERGGIKEI